MPKAYYNEFDPYAAQWLRNLIAAGHIAPGEVDQRSIEDVRPSDLAGFTQCHFFAGVGVWSLALRRAGWPDSRPVWTGSCPCQPFSAAGKGNGFADERHLWPALFHLIGQRNPDVVFGEQVSSKDADIWVDLVQTDMEALGYAFGAVPFPSAGIGAPHIRDRLYWLADSPECRSRTLRTTSQHGPQGANGSCGSGQPLRLDNPNNTGLEGFRGGHKTEGWGAGQIRPIAAASESCRVEHTTGDGWEQRWTESGWGSVAAGCPSSGLDDTQSQRRGLCNTANVWAPDAQSDFSANAINSQFDGPRWERASKTPARPVNGRWSDADWLFCRDGKWRPVEPGTFPLANGAPARVGRLRAYGNAINAEAAEAVIRSYMECRP